MANGLNFKVFVAYGTVSSLSLPSPYFGPGKENISLGTYRMKLFQSLFVVDLVEISRSATSILDAKEEGT